MKNKKFIVNYIMMTFGERQTCEQYDKINMKIQKNCKKAEQYSKIQKKLGQKLYNYRMERCYRPDIYGSILYNFGEHKKIINIYEKINYYRTRYFEKKCSYYKLNIYLYIKDNLIKLHKKDTLFNPQIWDFFFYARYLEAELILKNGYF